MPKITFLIRSDTIDLDNYTIKDIPGSSGRLDVLSRCILSALMEKGKFSKNFRIAIFTKYRNLLIDPVNLDYDSFPKNELLLTDFLVDLMRDVGTEKLKAYQNQIHFIETSFISYLNELKRISDNLYVLKEGGKDFRHFEFERVKDSDIYFIIGNQSEDIINSEDFKNLNIPEVSLGKVSYLASSVIRLIKLVLKIYVK